MFSFTVEPGLELRLWTPGMAGPLVAATRREQAHLSRWLPWATADYDLDAAHTYIRSTMAQYGKGLGLQTAVYWNDSLVGSVGLHAIDVPLAQSGLGYWLTSGAQGRGIMTRCCRAMRDIAFSEYGLERLELRAEPANRRSRAVAERLGFTLEGTLRHVARHGARFVDLTVYSQLREEWDPVPGPRRS